jgi:hypothetical protein
MSLIATVDGITNFILEARGESKAFHKWALNEIKLHILHCYIHKTVGVVFDEKTGAVVGVATGTRDIGQKTFYVNNVLTVRDGSKTMRLLLKIFKTEYPDYKLTARRHHKLKKYDTAKLLKKLSA